MPQEILSKKAQSVLESLNKKHILNNFYLAGGTALALQLKHRKSRDLDFFSQQPINPKVLITELKKVGKLSVEKEAKNTLIGTIKKINFSFMTYEFSLLKPLIAIKGIKVASVEDIGCMKLSAISSRGTKRDFIDLYFVCQKVPLKKLLKLFQKKYKEVDYSITHLLKSLVYFKSAEEEAMPQMIKPAIWKEVRNYLKAETQKLTPV